MGKTAPGLLILIFFLLTPLLSGRELNIHGVIGLTIPDEGEILSVSQDLRSHSKSDQYCLRIYVEMIYDNQYLPLKIDLFGYGDVRPLADDLEIEEIGSYSSEYRTADQKKYLKQNYIDYLEMTENIEFSRFVSEWASGISSDYYGIYFRMDNSAFDEAIISMINLWSAFGGSGLKNNDRDFREKAGELTESGQNFLKLLDGIIESIHYGPGVERNGSLVIPPFDEVRGYYLPTIGNLRMRSQPALSGKVLGYVGEYPYLIIGVGPEIEADGIRGRWYRLRKYIGTATGWAFSGYLRPLTEEEYIQYFEGI